MILCWIQFNGLRSLIYASVFLRLFLDNSKPLLVYIKSCLQKFRVWTTCLDFLHFLEVVKSELWIDEHCGKWVLCFLWKEIPQSIQFTINYDIAKIVQEINLNDQVMLWYYFSSWLALSHFRKLNSALWNICLKVVLFQ